MGLAQTMAYSAEKAIELLDQVREAQAYWEVMARDKTTSFFKRPAHQWFNKGWKSEVTNHQKALTVAEDRLIEFLAALSEDQKKISYESVTRLYRKTSFIISQHGVPSHFNRRWLSYATLAALAAGVAFYLHRFGQSHSLFIIPPQNEKLSSALDASRPFLGHDYVIEKDGTQYLQVKKKQEEDAIDFLSQRKVTYLKSAPRYSLCWYNEQGEHKISEFIRKHGIEPVKSMYRILRNERPLDLRALTTNVDFDLKEYEKQLTLVLKKAEGIEQTAPTLQASLKGRMLESLNFDQKREAFTSLLFSLGESVPQSLYNGIQGIHANIQEMEQRLKQVPPAVYKFDFEPVPLVDWVPGYNCTPAVNVAIKDYSTVRPDIYNGIQDMKHYFSQANVALEQTKQSLHSSSILLQENKGFVALITQILIVNGLELKLKGAALGHLIHTYSENMRLNIELSATIPLMIASYLTFAGGRSLYRHVLSVNLAKPLKTDLISLQLLFNKERYTKDPATLSTRFKGEYFYWFQRLCRYKDKLPSEYRATYRQFLDNIEDKTLLPEQKMTLISALLSQLDQLISDH